MKKLRSRTQMRLRTEITLFFLLILVLAIIILVICTQIYLGHANEENLALYVTQTLSTVSEGVGGRLDNLDAIVEVIFVNYQFQNQMQDTKSYLAMRNLLFTPLQTILLHDMNLFSVMYVSNRGEYVIEHLERNYSYGINTDEIQSYRWSKMFREANGDIFYVVNGGGVVTKTSNDEPYVTFVRELQKLNDYSRLGIIFINMSCGSLSQVLQGFITDSAIEVYICDRDNNIIADSGNSTEAGLQAAERLLLSGNTGNGLKTDGMKAFSTKLSSNLLDWKFIGVVPAEINISRTDYFIPFILIIGIIVALLVFIGQVYVTAMISAPLEEMTRYMSQVENANFVTIPIKNNGRHDEIVNLQIFFNQMITSMDNLIAKIAREEQIKRQNEISLLQAQIKPHFLYNALDAVSALSLIGDNDTAYRLTQALGGYYRTSLSGGREVVDIKTELECIKNYVTVLNIRYANKINLTFSVSDELLGVKVLKLILQPLIENSVYHGIRNRHGPGHIHVGAKKGEGRLMFIVEDDGVGMSSEKIEEIMSKASRSNNGFGIYSLIEKLRLFYNIENPVIIESEPGIGTKITVIVGILEL